MNRVSRRRMLSIVAATACVPWPALRASRAGTVSQWTGTAMGAQSSITIAAENADRVLELCRAEIARLEGIFSLYRSDSAIVQLNRNGHLVNPPPELVTLLSIADGVARETGGAFDPTVQSLWSLYAEHFAVDRGIATGPAEKALVRTLARTGWQHLEYSPRRIQFAQPGMGITLNGIAQGYIADQIIELLRNENLDRVAVETGEWRTMGTQTDGGPWQATFGVGKDTRTIDLVDRALAVSEPAGTKFDRNGRFGHILDPRTGRPADQWRQVAVRARTAALADAMSTSLCLLDGSAIAQMQDRRPEIDIWLG